MPEMLEKKNNNNILITPTSSQSITETVNGSHKFVIQNYSSAKGIGYGNYIASETFTVGGYQWAIYFYPDGKILEDNSTFVSVFIALASEGTDVRALFELTLVDQSGKENHKVHSHFDRSLESGPCTLNYRGSMWGYTRFFRRALLETSDFLKDDCLKINCTVGVVISTVDCSRLHSIQVPNSDIGSDFGLLLENREGSDVVFDVCGEKFQEGSDVVFGAEEPADWSVLPFELLNLILHECKEFNIANYLRFSVVCKWWHSVAKVVGLCNSPAVQLPLLMVPRNGWIRRLNSESHYFEDDYMEWNIDQEWDCRGSAYGWLFLVNKHMAPKLLNPFTGSEIPLPSLTTVPCPDRDDLLQPDEPRSIFPNLTEKAVRMRWGLDRWMVHKAFFSSNPSCWEHKPIVVLVIYGLSLPMKAGPTWLAYLNLGDKVWTVVEGMDTHPIPIDKKWTNSTMISYPTVCFRDAIFFLDEVLLLDVVGNIVTLDLNTNTLSCDYPSVDRYLSYYHRVHPQFLVEYDGELVVILIKNLFASSFLPHLYGTVNGLHLLLFVKSIKEWVELEDLGGDAIFIGLNSSIHLPMASEHPGCEADCIYFTNDRVGYDLNMFYLGVFDMKHKSFRPLYRIGDVPFIPVSIWITPLLISHPKSESPKNQSPSVQEGSNIDKMLSNPHFTTRKMSFGEIACTYATLILHVDGIPITGKKIATLVKAANVDIESYWPGLFAKLVEKRNVEDLITNFGCGGGGGAAPMAVSAPSGGGAAAAAALTAEEKKEEPKEESEDDMGFSLFD